MLAAAPDHFRASDPRLSAFIRGRSPAFLRPPPRPGRCHGRPRRPFHARTKARRSVHQHLPSRRGTLLASVPVVLRPDRQARTCPGRPQPLSALRARPDQPADSRCNHRQLLRPRDPPVADRERVQLPADRARPSRHAQLRLRLGQLRAGLQHRIHSPDLPGRLRPVRARREGLPPWRQARRPLPARHPTKR